MHFPQLVSYTTTSEETGSESGSGSQMTTRYKVFFFFFYNHYNGSSPEANSITESLDRKIKRMRSEHAKEMCHILCTGLPSSRASPEENNPSAWDIVDADWLIWLKVSWGNFVLVRSLVPELYFLCSYELARHFTMQFANTYYNNTGIGTKLMEAAVDESY